MVLALWAFEWDVEVAEGSEDFRFLGTEDDWVDGPKYARMSDFGCEEFSGSSTIRMGSSTSTRSVRLRQHDDQKKVGTVFALPGVRGASLIISS